MSSLSCVHSVRFIRLAIGLLSIYSLMACTHLWQAGWQTATLTQAQKIDLQKTPLDPNLRYLKLSINQNEVLMVEAYRAGTESVWISEDLAIFKTRNGYLADLEGFRINWQAVRGPDLNIVTQLTNPTAYTRIRNEMPGYRYQLRESVRVTPLPSAPHDFPLSSRASAQWRWYSEEVISQMGGQLPNYRYPGLFAIDASQNPPQVVVGRQCLAIDYCLTWQLLEASSRAKL